MAVQSSETDPDHPLNFCIIVPTYNNGKTLKRVLDAVLEYTSKIIVVNDGSTDMTAQILEKYSHLVVMTLSKNSGKGIALQLGFEKARSLNYEYAITIDSDGQHFASDIPKFLEAIQNEGTSLVIGSRNMAQEGIPKKSSFGNTFSNFWFWFETGIRLEDTQSGYRLYPLRCIPKKYFTTKFEFEIEVIVRSAWKGIPVKNIPIRVLYDMTERVSHFRPFRDFVRISILNTVLVLLTFLYAKPRALFLDFKKKGWKSLFLESGDSRIKKSSAVALGVFIGIAPFWGFQTVIVLFLAVLLRLNKVISFAFSNISFPPFIPFIIYGSLKLGGYFVGVKKPWVFHTSMTFSDIQNNSYQYIVGSFVLAFFMAGIFWLLSYLVLTLYHVLKK